MPLPRPPWMPRTERHLWRSATTLIDPAYADNVRLWDVLTRVAAGETVHEPEDDESFGLGDWVEPPMTECRLCGAPYFGRQPLRVARPVPASRPARPLTV